MSASSGASYAQSNRLFSLILAAVMLLGTACILGLMIFVNYSGSAYQVVQGTVTIPVPVEGSLPSPITGAWIRYEGCHTPDELDGLTGIPVGDIRSIRVDGNATYQFFIRTDQDFYFNQVVSSRLTLWINGTEVLSETGEKLNRAQYDSLKKYANGTDTYSVVARLDSGPRKTYGYWGLLLGTHKQILNQMNIQTLLDLSLVGMYLMMLIACIALYAQKTSERYLLLLSFVTVMSLLRWLPQIRFAPLIHPGLNSIFYSDLFVFVRFFLFRQFVSERIWKKLLPFAGMTAALWLISYCTHDVVRMCLFLCCYVLTEGAAIVSGLSARRPGNRILAAGWCVNLSIELFYLLLNAGLLPQGVIDICIRPMPHGRLIYLIAFFIAIFGIFARKFRIADDLTERLDLRVQEQTAALLETNRQLSHAKAVKQNFMADIAHDLRNPLFAMGGYLDLLNRAMPQRTDAQARYLKRLDTKLQDMTQMVNDLLYMARLEDGRIEFHFTEFSLPDMLETVAADGRAKIHDKHITIEVAADSLPDRMTGDSFRLREALDNLLSNAIRYSHDGGVITLSARNEENSMLSLSVQDYGDGITPEALAGIFERYSAKGERGENGLGLAICREIVRIHRGEISVQSTPGAGTRVTILLPRQL